MNSKLDVGNKTPKYKRMVTYITFMQEDKRLLQSMSMEYLI